jgi:mono/diheme cytochrome c family protein
MKSLFKILFPIIIALNLSACRHNTFKEDKIFAGGLVVSKADLNAGKMLYTEYCMACHGVDGDGKGYSHKGMQVPPRDFTLGIYKFGHVVSGELPHDEDFYKLLREGLHGTAMLPWDMSEKQMYQVMQYIKTFAPEAWEGEDKELGERLVVTRRDPYGLAHRNAAIQRGKEVYHAVAQCQACHRAYVSFPELSQINEKEFGAPLERNMFDPMMYYSRPQPSQYGYNSLPPDMTWHHVRSAKTVDEIYIRMLAGVGGAAMPSWKDTLADEDIWAVSHYVHYLMSLKDNPARKDLMRKIEQENAQYFGRR